MIAAIPTEYAGIRFRSRLEAKWAAFFDGIAAPWSYEPIDLPGWIPDFRLMDPCRPEQFVLLDSKPVRVFPAETGRKIERASRGNGDEAVSWDAYVLAESPMPIPGFSGARQVGWLNNGHPLMLGETATGLVFGLDLGWQISAAPFFPGWPSFPPGRLPYLRDGGALIDRIWAKACNATQWRRQ